MTQRDTTAEHPRSGSPVVHLLAPARVGGLETVVRSLARHQVESGQSVAVGAIGSSHDAVAPFLDRVADRVPTHFLQVPTRGYLRERRAVGELLTELDARLLHTHGQRVDVVDGGVARKVGLPVVSTAHGFIGRGVKGRLYRFLQTRCWRGFNAVVAVSKPLADELDSSGVPRSRLHVVPNAWEPDRPPRSEEDARASLGVNGSAFHIGWIGRLSPEKGPDVFLQALDLLRRRDHAFAASVIGEGPLERELRSQAESAGIRDRIRWHGRVPGASELLAAFDVIVISSRTEGTPMVLLEAMFQGVPLVATAVGGIPFTLGKKEGYLVPSEDAEAIAEALSRIRRRPGEAEARASCARTRIRRERSMAQWVQRYEEVYRAAEAEMIST